MGIINLQRATERERERPDGAFLPFLVVERLRRTAAEHRTVSAAACVCVTSHLTVSAAPPPSLLSELPPGPQ